MDIQVYRILSTARSPRLTRLLISRGMEADRVYTNILKTKSCSNAWIGERDVVTRACPMYQADGSVKFLTYTGMKRGPVLREH